MAYKEPTDIELIQGEYFELQIQRINTDTEEPIPVTGDYGRFQVRKWVDHPTAIVDIDTEGAYINNGGELGTFDIFIPATVTETYETIKDGVWEFESHPEGEPERLRKLVRGKATILREIAR